jgi:epidermal growth factor receptor substrate 15
MFVTPPASVIGMHETPKGPDRTFTPLDAAVSRFPSIPGAFSDEPDPIIRTKEEVDEDSSDDDGEPEEAVAAPKQQAPNAPSPAPAEVSKKSSTGSSFDDVFGVGSETSASMISMPSTVTPNQTGNDASKSPFQPALSTGINPLSVSTSSDKPADQPNGTVAGKNAFDEAMGVIPSSQTPVNASFGFDSAFDDDFDFAAAKANSNTPLFPTPVHVQSPPKTNGAFSSFPPAPTSTGASSNVNGGFDSAFGVDSFSPAPAPAPATPTIQLSGQDKEQDKPFSFDTVFGTTTTATTTKPETTETDTKGGGLRPTPDGVPIFGGDRTSKAMALFSAFGSGSVPQMPSSPTLPVQFPQPSKSPPPPQRSSSPPPGSNGSIHSHYEQSSSRLTPPKSRPTTADKLKEKEHPTRSSRLSVSLKLLH